MDIDIIKRLRQQLKEGQGALPWPFGFDTEKDSSADPAIRRLFKPEELLAISKHNPFLNCRDNEIRKLKNIGMLVGAMSALSGLSISQIKRITGPHMTRSSRNKPT